MDLFFAFVHYVWRLSSQENVRDELRDILAITL